MSLNAAVRVPLARSRTVEDGLVRHSLVSTRTAASQSRRRFQRLVVEAKGKKGMMSRQFQRAPPPPIPKIEDDGNPKFVIFIRMADVRPFPIFSLPLSVVTVLFNLHDWFVFGQVNFWYPLSIITGGTTAKIMLAAKDNFLGKYIYKDTLARNLGAVIYRVSFFCYKYVHTHTHSLSLLTC